MKGDRRKIRLLSTALDEPGTMFLLVTPQRDIFEDPPYTIFRCVNYPTLVGLYKTHESVGRVGRERQTALARDKSGRWCDVTAKIRRQLRGKGARP